MPGSGQQVANSVGKAIHRAIRAMEGNAPAWRHFQQAIKTGAECAYLPPTEIEWGC